MCVREKKEKKRKREREKVNHFLLCAGSDHVRESEIRGEPTHEQEKMNEEGGSVGVCVCALADTVAREEHVCICTCLRMCVRMCACVCAHTR